MPVEHAITRIYDTRHTVIGTGFLVADRHVMTCAHVVNTALGRDRAAADPPTDPITLDFPSADDHEPLTAHIDPDRWLPMGEGDVAVLRLETDPPAGAQCAELGAPGDIVRAGVCWTRGFGYPDGMTTKGEIRGSHGRDRFQIDLNLSSQYSVEEGFSGAPVWDIQDRVLGMVAEADHSTEGRVAIAISVETLIAACPEARTAPSVAGKRVFISYSRDDSDFAGKLQRDLNAQGIETWRDTTSIPGAADWYQSIMTNLRQMDALLLIVTTHSDASRWVLREALYADQWGIPIIPVFPVEYRPRRQLEFLLINLQPVLCDVVRYDDSITHIIDRIALAERPTTNPAATDAPTAVADRQAELDYLDFLISEVQYDLDTRHYVQLAASADAAVPRRPSRERRRKRAALEMLVGPELERIDGDDFAQSGDVVEDARTLILEKRRAVLLGDPGSGKTTTLMQLAIDMAEAARTDENAPLPVLVSLPGYDGAAGTFAEFVGGHLKNLETSYPHLLSEGRLVLLLDALNEMPRGAGRSLVDDVRGFLDHALAWTVSCRVRDYTDELSRLADVAKIRLKPLDPPRIHQMIQRRFLDEPQQGAALWKEMGGSDDLLDAWALFAQHNQQEALWQFDWPRVLDEQFSDENAQRREKWRLRRSLNAPRHDRRQLLLLCRNPYMLWMVNELFEAEGGLPDNRGDLFQKFVAALLTREEAISQDTGTPWLPTKTIRLGLARLAYAMQVSETGTEITRAHAEHILENEASITNPTLLLQLGAAANLLLVSDQVRYTHQLLQEYFAGQVLRTAMEAGQPATDFWPPDAWWKPQGWEETAIILAGASPDPRNGAAWAERVVRWIAPAQPVLAYRALTKSGIDIELDTIQPETRATLVDAASTKKDEADPIGRAAAYRILGRFDADVRPGIGLREDGLPDLVVHQS